MRRPGQRRNPALGTARCLFPAGSGLDRAAGRRRPRPSPAWLKAQWRVYSPRLEPLAELDEWLGSYRALWQQRLDALHKRWVADVEGDLRLGGEFQARFTSGWAGPGRVEACVPPRRLMLTMSPGQEDETVIEALLTAEGDRTCLVIEERGLPLDKLYAHGAGWQAHVEDLGVHLAGGEPGDWLSNAT